MFTRPNADGTFTEQDKLHATDAATDDNFGIPFLCTATRR